MLAGTAFQIKDEHSAMRDPGKAAAFLKAYCRLATEDPWAQENGAVLRPGPCVA